MGFFFRKECIVSGYHRGAMVYYREIVADSFAQFLFELSGDDDFNALWERYHGVKVLVRFMPDDEVFVVDGAFNGMYFVDKLMDLNVDEERFRMGTSSLPVVHDFSPYLDEIPSGGSDNQGWDYEC